jgi:hypothetical protein
VFTYTDDLLLLGADALGWCDYIDLSVSWLDDGAEPRQWRCPSCGGTKFEGVHCAKRISRLRGRPPWDALTVEERLALPGEEYCAYLTKEELELPPRCFLAQPPGDGHTVGDRNERRLELLVANPVAEMTK